MIFDIEIEIDLPRDKVIALIRNKELIPQWHSSIKNFELISGKPDEVGAKSLVTLEQSGRTFTFESVVIKSDLPNEISSRGSKEGEFTITTTFCFEELTPTKTRITENIEMYIDAIESDAKKTLLAFKEFAESQD